MILNGMNLLRLISKMQFLSEKKRVELYPPFWLMRVKVLELSDNWRTVRIKLPLTMFSRNMGGGMYGGFQASLADPIAALACAKIFPGYSVWTRAMEIDFHQEGRTDLELRFNFAADQEAAIRQELEQKGRSTPTFEYGFYLRDGTQCTRVINTVAIRPMGYKTPGK
jgi:acyl-coenzyme A thioesterase PaaI-like protein